MVVITVVLFTALVVGVGVYRNMKEEVENECTY